MPLSSNSIVVIQVNIAKVILEFEVYNHMPLDDISLQNFSAYQIIMSCDMPFCYKIRKLMNLLTNTSSILQIVADQLPE